MYRRLPHLVESMCRSLAATNLALVWFIGS